MISWSQMSARSSFTRVHFVFSLIIIMISLCHATYWIQSYYDKEPVPGQNLEVLDGQMTGLINDCGAISGITQQECLSADKKQRQRLRKDERSGKLNTIDVRIVHFCKMYCTLNYCPTLILNCPWSSFSFFDSRKECASFFPRIDIQFFLIDLLVIMNFFCCKK